MFTLVSLLIYSFHLDIELASLLVLDYLVMSLILVGDVLLVPLYLFLQRNKNILLLIHFLNDVLPLHDNVLFLFLDGLYFSK